MPCVTRCRRPRSTRCWIALRLIPNATSCRAETTPCCLAASSQTRLDSVFFGHPGVQKAPTVENLPPATAPGARSARPGAKAARHSGPAELCSSRGQPSWAAAGSQPSWPTSITRRSWVPTPIVRSPSVTSTSKRSLRPSTTSRRTVADPAGRALGGRRDVLDADLEADRRAALGQVLEASTEELPPSSRSSPASRARWLPIVPPTSVTSRPSTDELVAALDPRLEPHVQTIPRASLAARSRLRSFGSLRAQTIPRPPLTPSVSPVT